MRNERYPNSVSMPRYPTSEDVRAYMDFLSDEHPLLLEVITRAAEALVGEAENPPLPQAPSYT